MHRERGAPNFAARDVNLLESLSGGFEEVQRSSLERDLSAHADDGDPGLLLLDDEDGYNATRARTAVTLEPARAPELAELIADAYGLTARERRVTELVAQGLPSAAIAARLYLPAYTVQDHLKAIFEKLDVSSRGQLVAMLFVDHGQVGGHLNDAPALGSSCGR